jgi:hypothetical protein
MDRRNCINCFTLPEINCVHCDYYKEFILNPHSSENNTIIKEDDKPLTTEQEEFKKNIIKQIEQSHDLLREAFKRNKKRL